MKKRILLLSLLCFLLCGCTAEVNIDLDLDSVQEEISIFATADTQDEKEELDNAFREYMPIYGWVAISDNDPDEESPGVDYYDREVINTNYGYEYRYKHKFSYSEYNQSRLIKKSFKSAYIEKNIEEDILEFYTDSDGIILMDQFPSLSRVNVNITTECLVLSTNADSVKGNTYTWEFDRDNYHKNIYIKISTKQKNKNDNTGENGGSESGNSGNGGNSESGNNTGNNTGNNNEDHKSTLTVAEVEEDPTKEKLNSYVWLIFPVVIIGFLVIVVIINKIAKGR